MKINVRPFKDLRGHPAQIKAEGMKTFHSEPFPETIADIAEYDK